MAKHSKGKHGKPKQGSGFPFGRKDAKPSEAVGSDEETTAEGDAQEDVKMGAHAAGAGEASKPDASADGEKGAEQQGPSDDAKDAADEQPEGSSEGQADPGAFMSSSDILEDKKKKRRKVAKRIGIATLSTIGGLAAIYFIGVAVFSTHFMPNTHIDDLDLSFMTPEEVQSDFDGRVGDYTIKVKGNGLNIAFTSKEAGIAIDSAGMTQAVAAAQDPWKWPVEVFRERDMTSAMTDSLSATTLSDVVAAAVDKVNATAKDPVNAYVAYDQELGAFDIVPEVPGTPTYSWAP